MPNAFSEMRGPAAKGDSNELVKWLSPEQEASWQALIRLTTWLPRSIDQQLQRDSNLSMVEFRALAVLSHRQDGKMRMSSLAQMTNASLSHLSHVVTRLEKRGLVYRQPDPVDGRFTNAILTTDGFHEIEKAVPMYFAHARSIVIDVLTREQLRLLGRAAERVMRRIDTLAGR
jgi:DNA-binding MarR family transcriptional regulator